MSALPVVHLVEVFDHNPFDATNPNQPSPPLRFIASVDNNNIIIHGPARPVRRVVELEIEHDSNNNGINPHPRRYTATVEEHHIILHIEARPDDDVATSSSPAHHATPPLPLLEAAQFGESTRAEDLNTSDEADYESDLSAVSTTGEVNTGKQGSTRGIAERVKTAGTYINRRQKSAKSQPGADAEEKYVVESLLKQVENDDDENDPWMLVKWKGWKERTWQRRSILLEDVPEEVRKFDARQLGTRAEQSLSPLRSQPWPTGISKAAFRNLDVISQDVNVAVSSSSSGSSHSAVEEREDSDSEDDDAPIPRRSNVRHSASRNDTGTTGLGRAVLETPRPQSSGIFVEERSSAKRASAATAAAFNQEGRPIHPADGFLYGSQAPTPASFGPDTPYEIDTARPLQDIEDVTQHAQFPSQSEGHFEGAVSETIVSASHVQSPLQLLPTTMQRMRAQSPYYDSIFDGPTPTPSFWEQSPGPQSNMSELFVRPRPNRETSGLFVTPEPEASLVARRNTSMTKSALSAAEEALIVKHAVRQGPPGIPLEGPIGARLAGKWSTVAAKTRTIRPQSRATKDGLGYAHLSHGEEASSTGLTPDAENHVIAFERDHRKLPPASNKRRLGRPPGPSSPKRAKQSTKKDIRFYGIGA